MFLSLAALLGGAMLTGCPRYGVVDDGTSISFGPAHRGTILNPARVPRRGTGFWSPPRWHNRGLRYGTDEMIALITHAGRQMHASDRRAVIGVADLSLKHGGPSAWHRSHQTGRDVDLLFFALDAEKNPLKMTSMVHFRNDGTGTLPGETPEQPAQTIYFDSARNWRLVRTLIENPIAQVQYIFVSNGLRHLLIEHARAAGEPEALVLTASHLMRQPGVSPHDDHFHVRIYCAYTDRALGCVDRGMLRWNKKDYKYGTEPSGSQLAQNLLPSVAPMPAMMALVPVMFRP